MDYEQFRRSEVVDPVDPRVFQRYVLDRLIGSTSTTHFFICTNGNYRRSRTRKRSKASYGNYYDEDAIVVKTTPFGRDVSKDSCFPDSQLYSVAWRLPRVHFG